MILKCIRKCKGWRVTKIVLSKNNLGGLAPPVVAPGTGTQWIRGLTEQRVAKKRAVTYEFWLMTKAAVQTNRVARRGLFF